MKARPILFSGPMVRAILEGRKTQTRRIVKGDYLDMGERDDGSLWPWREDCENGGDIWLPCPYGKPGDVLWCREGFGRRMDGKVYHRADQTLGQFNVERWHPSIHMPRKLSRITLEIESIRVERLQDISESDARTEGVELLRAKGGIDWWRDYRNEDRALMFPSVSFQSLWQSINGPESWSANPWVWVVSFRAHMMNVDEFLKQREAA